MNKPPGPSLPILVPLVAIVCGCISHSVESAPIEVKPIHITMDINLRVQRELDDFFDFEEPPAPVVVSPPRNPGQE